MSREHVQVWKRPATARYVVSIDNQAKKSFDTREIADQEARKIAEGFPKVVVKVIDTEPDARTSEDPEIADNTGIDQA
ncbi:hypothetical protein CWB41_13395 [Methylovirgula ligni]|uniref:DUF2188 domain-containing protein n=1 Tax=Methylovirgula ligni TaxID=569860 RepID=A0A3D9YNE8_9HYPH|nr:hypothetical protein [Methylovirgula ligni]QAY96602.1 hypothetical protein CWB41_13395 [Methylovirgula ligni]REF84087.1 hypothetical protein DES32_2932 [Methylovirgula ligni]